MYVSPFTYNFSRVNLNTWLTVLNVLLENDNEREKTRKMFEENIDYTPD